MTGDPRLVRVLLACYPAAWRQRYGDEYAQLLCDLRVSQRPALILDSLRGAIRTHGGVLMSNSSPMSIAVWAAGLFTVAGIGFQKLSEDFAGIAVGTRVLLVVAAAVALVGLAAAAAPTAVGLVRGRAPAAWRYVVVPVVGGAVWLGVLLGAVVLSGNDGVHSARNVAAFVVVVGTGIAVVAATAWAATAVVKRVPTAPSNPLRSRSLLIVAAGMGVATAAVLTWGLQVHADDPSGFGGDHGILATPFVPSWIAAVILMAIATALAAAAGRRQLALDRAMAPPATSPRSD